MSSLSELLSELAEYFAQRADVIRPGVPNTEMHFLTLVQEEIEREKNK